MSMEQQVYRGKNTMVDFATILRMKKPKEIFLVRGKKSFELCGAKKIVDSIVDSIKCRVTEFWDFSANPTYEDMQKGLQLLSESHADLIIGIGGGSVLDMSKIIRFYYSFSEDSITGEFSKQRDLLPLIVLPTTAGSGSEATHFAVIYKDKIKHSIAHAAILPDIAFIYSPFTYTNSKYLAACAGFDALAHAIEAYWNVHTTNESDEYAIQAIKLLWHNLPDVVHKQTEEAKDNVSEGSYWAGKAINITKTTAPHAMSYVLTAHYNIPHGQAVSFTFPYFFKENFRTTAVFHPSLDIEKHLAKRDTLYKLLNIDHQDPGICMQKYIDSIGLTIPAQTFDIDFIARNINMERAANNPVLVLEDIKRQALSYSFTALKRL